MENWNLTLPHESSCAALKPPQKLAERLKVNYHVREAMSNILIILLKDPESAFKSLPFQGLPKFLYPQDRFYNPPVLHYGYAFSWEWLWDYAANRNLLRNYAKTRSNMKWLASFNFDATLKVVLEYIAKEAEITSFTLEHQLLHTLPSNPNHQHMLCICSNYRREGKDETPTLEDVKKLQRFLRFQDLPGWYLDYEDWGWGLRHPERFYVQS